MFELQSLPTSLRKRLERAEELADDGREADASRIFIEVGRELAKTNPELCGLLLAEQFGFTTITFEEVDAEETHMQKPHKNIFGKIVGVEHHHTRKVKSHKKRWSLS